MAHQHRQQRGFQSFSGPWLAVAVMTLMCAAAPTSAQQLPPPLPVPQPQPQPQPTTTPPAIPSMPACAPAMATLSPCFSYLFGNSSSPPTECCAQIRAMFQSQAPCLCAAMVSGPAQQLGSALGQMLPVSCDLPADACSGGTNAAPAGPVTPASGTTSAAAPVTEPNGMDPTAPAGGAGMKSLPSLPASAAAAGSSGMAAAALFMSLLVVYLL